ncbi:MAG: hypothetical protein CMJ48_07780, partial [Planctomycetaceae bacterium]|nr:hypothetical protein [Planctomycetaceae bacterium]
MSLYLVMTSGPDHGRQTALQDHEIVLIGRGELCGVQLNDPSASRVHCRVTTAKGRVYLEDAGSRWGTLVNGTPVESRELLPGDCITIGDSEIELQRRQTRATTISPARKRKLANPLTEPEEFTADDFRRSGGKLFEQTPAVRLVDLVGETFSRYRVGAVVARSRSGIVFRALETSKNRTVALKIFWPDFFREERNIQRFLRAVRTTLPFEHENLIQLHAAGRHAGLCFTAAEFIEGESLTAIIDRVGVAGMLDWRKAWRVAVGVTQALQFAHEKNIVHRNLCPDNVLVRSEDQVVKLGGLMLAKALDEVSDARITQPGELVGDAHYLAPEQLAGETHIDQRADLYSLGAMLYAILTGRPPFVGSVADVIRKALGSSPHPPTKYHLAIPAMFEGIVLRLLAKRRRSSNPTPELLTATRPGGPPGA